MATLDWPTLPGFRPTRMRFGATTPKSAWGGFYTGQTQSISHLADRLRVEISLPPCRSADAGAREAFLMQLASSGDWVRLGHFMRPAPLGDMRGATVVHTGALAGARTLRIGQATTPTNLLTGTQAFDSAADWTLGNSVAVTANTHARPNTATVSADTLTDSSGTLGGNVSQTVAIVADSATYTGSVYVRKTSGGTSATFAMVLTLGGGTAGNSILRINTDSGAILGGTGNSVASGDGLYWLVDTSITNDGTNTTLQFRLDPARGVHGSATTSAAATGSAVVWGAQLEPGAVRTEYEGTPALQGGDVIGVGSQLCIVGYEGETQNSLPYLSVPLAIPLRQAATAGDAVTWQSPTGNFQLLGDLSAVEYLPGRYQDAITLSFVEAY